MIACAAASSGAIAAADVDDARLLDAQREPQNWLTHGGDWSEQRYSRLDAINVETVKRLRPAWSFEFDTTRGQESTPLVVDGVMYVTTAWSKVYALDAATGALRWFFDPKVPGAAGVPTCCDVNNRGVAIYHGKVYVGAVDGRLIALDAANGHVIWSTATTTPGSLYSITGAPRAAHGKIFIGNAGADFGGRGYVSAYDASSGRLIWRFYTVPGDPAAPPDGAASDEVLARVARPTWFGDWYRYGGGGHVWNAIVYDPDFNQLYFGTGNGYPWNQNFRSSNRGDNLFVSSIVAVDADTGRYIWHYQEAPGDRWDFDAVADITLVELTLDGKSRRVLLHAPKNGFCYVIDRRTGKLLSAKPFVPVNWATRVDLTTGRPLIVPAARYKDTEFTGRPGGGGGHNWNPVAFSPRTQLLYIPARLGFTRYRPLATYQTIPGLPNLGIELFEAQHGNTQPAVAALAGRPEPDYLLAWNPVTQSEAWRAEGGGGGVLATAGGLVFQGRSRDGLLGELVAFKADDGRKLWSANTPDAIIAGPVTYSVGGRQFVAASSGASLMSFGARARVRHSGHLVAFTLDGSAKLPPDPDLPQAANPPADTARPADVMAGESHYGRFCSRCHGIETVSSNVIPDLRRSAALTNPEAWQQIVIGGALADHGMVSWSRFLSAEDAERIRRYVGEKARALQKSESLER